MLSGCCSTCRKEINRNGTKPSRARHLRACHAGPMPTVEDVAEDIRALSGHEDDFGDGEE